MDFDLFSCTFENLNSLKFNELQKLSSKYRVNKRWAKKREIIDKLLFLKDQEIQKRNVPSNIEKNVSQDNEQWIDGSKVFSSPATDKASDSNEIDRRLTYNVCNQTEEIVDRRLTFNVVKDEGNKNIAKDINFKISDDIDRRLTYNADELKGIQSSLKSTIDVSNTENQINSVKLSVPVNELTKNHDGIMKISKDESMQPKKQFLLSEKLNSDNKEVNVDTQEARVIDTSHTQLEKYKGLRSAKTKMLTIPYSRIPAQTRKPAVKELQMCDTAVVKLNEKLPVTSRLVKTKCDISKEPHSLQKLKPPSNNKVIGSTKSVIDQNNGFLTSKSNVCSTSVKMGLPTQTADTKRRILPRRKSKTEDNVLVTNLKSSRNLKFFSPTQSDMKNHKRLSEPNSLHLDLNLRSKIPKAQAMVETQKPLTAKKMPDFSKIHQRQFEQMDSLLDYKRKKEERAKKLFGIPQPGIPVRINKNNVSTTLFQFKSTHNEKENNVDKTARTLKKPNQDVDKELKEKPNRQDLMHRGGYKSNIVKNMKEQNRKHLNGVRTNKRFELQMKFRQT